MEVLEHRPLLGYTPMPPSAQAREGHAGLANGLADVLACRAGNIVKSYNEDVPSLMSVLSSLSEAREAERGKVKESEGDQEI